MIRYIALFFACMLSALSAYAQDDALKRPIVFGTGGAGGTYSTTFNQWKQVCSQYPLQEHKVQEGSPARNTVGTTENLDLLLANKIAGAYVQADAVWNLLQRDPNMQSLRTLAVLYPEAVHVLALNKPIMVKGTKKTMGIEYSTDVEKTLSTVADLSGHTVVAWGGSAVTAGIIRDHILKGQLRVLEVKNKDEAMKAVQDGTAQAIIAVGGYPVDWIRALNSSWKLLAFPKALREKVGSSYAEVKLTYTTMGATGIESGETQSMLVAQNYGPKRAAEITSAFDCMVKNMEDLRDGDGMHPAWKKIDLRNKGNILLPFPFVRETPSAPPPAPAKKKGS